MKSLPTLLAIALLGVGVAACGSAGRDASQASSAAQSATTYTPPSTAPSKAPPAPVQSRADGDHDNDTGAVGDDTNNNSVLDFGHAAGTSDKQTITALLKRYYAAAAAEDGARACSMLYSTLAEAVPEDYGQSPPGQPYMRGTTCPAVMTLLFKHFHPQITLELPRLDVARVRLIEHHGLAVLHFGAMPERKIAVAREGHTWKVEALLDGEVP
jgi:hypothetical protein